MTLPNPEHPAKFSPVILDELRWLVKAEADRLERKPSLLDPFAGVGRIHQLEDIARTYGVELEPEWAACHHRTRQGDALRLVPDLFRASRFDIVATSPVYPNRTTDHHEAKDASRRITYRHKLGRMPSEGSASVLGWGSAYREMHEAWLVQARRVLRGDGLLIVNMSNHMRTRKGESEVVYVVEWWVGAVAAAGFTIEQLIPVETSRMRFGQNHGHKGTPPARVPCEHLIVARKP